MNNEVLAKILDKEPKIIKFDSDDTLIERLDKLKCLTFFEKEVMTKLLIQDIIGLNIIDCQKLPKEHPIYYMMPKCECSALNEEEKKYRSFSPDWALMIFEKKGIKIFDLTGCLKETEIGIIWMIRRQKVIKLFSNNDGILYFCDENINNEFVNTMLSYEQKRQQLIYTEEDYLSLFI